MNIDNKLVGCFLKGCKVFLKEEYLNHPTISGNKLRKLKYNIQEAEALHKDCLLTFGGAFSNHIAATAAAGKLYGFKTVGVIRGEELEEKISENPTLSFAQSQGMEFKFVSRSVYRKKSEIEFVKQLQKTFGNFYILPEGGTNKLAVKGCEEILTPADEEMDYVCCPVGTGGTISGLINASKPHQTILGFPALKGDFLQNDISTFVNKDNWQLIHDYHFGGYGKVTDELVTFVNNFYEQTKIPLDPIYTGKMVFGIFDMLAKGYFKPNAKILIVHTGGLQGIAGMNQLLAKKGRTTIAYDEI